MIHSLLDAASSVGKVSSRSDDDLVDRLHHRHTASILVICAVVVTTTQYVGNPIHCWAPAYFTSNHEEFANKMCWVSYTYYLPEGVVPGQPGAIKQHISYYQCVPMFLLVQAFLFYLPRYAYNII